MRQKKSHFFIWKGEFMIQDLVNNPEIISVGEKSYKMEYDNRAYAELELKTGKNIFYIYDALMIDKTLKIDEMLELLCCGLLKHHSADEIETVKTSFSENISLFMKNRFQITYAFLKPLFPQEFYEKNGNAEKKS